MSKHKHYDVIMAAAEGKEIQARVDDNCDWQTYDGEVALRTCSWLEYQQYRIKPEVKYPETRVSHDELHNAYSFPPGLFTDAVKRVANLAIRRAIQDGDVILPNKD